MSVTPLVSGVIGAGNLISQAYWNRQNIDFQRQQNAQNRLMTWDLWNAENRYNTPAAQMARLRAAGLNPGLMYSDGSAGMPAAATHSPEQTAPQGKPLYLDPLTAASVELSQSQARLAEAQAENANADALKKRSETKYQDFINDLNEQLKNIPVGEVRVVDDSGQEETHIIYDNYHLALPTNTLRKLKLDNQHLDKQIAELAYNLALLTGSDTYDGTTAASETPNFDAHQSALHGDWRLRYLSSEMAEIEKEVAEAEKAGIQEYNKWLQANKDNPIVQLLLGIQGFVRTFFKGASLPSVTISHRTVKKS